MRNLKMLCLSSSVSIHCHPSERSKDRIDARDSDLSRVRLDLSRPIISARPHIHASPNTSAATTTTSKQTSKQTNTHPDIRDLEVVNDERIARRALPQPDAEPREVDGQAELRGPRRVGVREREDAFLEAEDAAPAREHERVVRGHDRDDVDALGFERGHLREVRRRVVRVARGLRGRGEVVSVRSRRTGWRDGGGDVR